MIGCIHRSPLVDTVSLAWWNRFHSVFENYRGGIVKAGFMEFKIIQISPENHLLVQKFIEHIWRSIAESGHDGDEIFAPFEELPLTISFTSETVLKETALSVQESNWMRAWVLVIKGQVIGACVLKGKKLKSEMHKCALSMGIERKFRKKGYGKKLMDKAIQWAKEQSQLRWIELGVYKNNLAARKLYQDFSFIECGFAEDACRVFGQSIDEIQMRLDLKK